MDIDRKSLRTSAMLDPISPEVLESNLLLDRALKHLGLVRKWRNGNWFVFDHDKYPYTRLRNFADGGVQTISSLSDFLKTECFECYRFSFSKEKNYNIVVNPFHNMTKEELAVRLDLLEA